MHLLAAISSAILMLALMRVPEVSGEESPAQDFGKSSAGEVGFLCSQ